MIRLKHCQLLQRMMAYTACYAHAEAGACRRTTFWHKCRTSLPCRHPQYMLELGTSEGIECLTSHAPFLHVLRQMRGGAVPLGRCLDKRLLCSSLLPA